MVQKELQMVQINTSSFFNSGWRNDQWLRSLPQDMGLVPIMYIRWPKTSWNSGSRGSDALWLLLVSAWKWCTYNHPGI